MTDQPSGTDTPFSCDRKALLVVAGLYFGAWLLLNVVRLTGTQHGLIRLALGTGFALAILLRRKPAPVPRAGGATRGAVLIAAALCGVLAEGFGIVFAVRQAEWLGMLLLLFACLRWSLPARYGPDLWRALLFLYWLHPIPSQIFGPLQLYMQRLSVAGAEFFLHIVNIRVWADGLVLKTGYHAFGVPESCSGMETATTVFLLGLGLGILRRLRWYESGGLIIAGLLQALALNILRVSLMVVFGVRHAGDPTFVTRFIHDTLGFLLLGVISLVVIELHLYENWRKSRKIRRELVRAARAEAQETGAGAGLRPEAQETGALTVDTSGLLVAADAQSDFVPPVWGVLMRGRWLVLGGLVLAVLVGVVAYRVRPVHRAEMLKDVAEGLQFRKDYEQARDVTGVARAIAPKDSALNFVRIQILLQSGEYAQVLEELRNIKGEEEADSPEARILGAYARMALGRREQALALIEELPPDVQRHPRVAIIMAEIASFAGEPDKAARHILRAPLWPGNIERIRRLYPFLGLHGKWRAIARSDLDVDYTDPKQALLVAQAHMNLREIGGVGAVVRKGLRLWPTEIRFLTPLYYLALKRPQSEWTLLYCRHLLRCLPSTGPDALAGLFDSCFRLRRPDLAWLLYRQIQATDASHPALPMAIARYGHLWLRFAKEYLGVELAGSAELIDLKPLYLATRDRQPWRLFWRRVPEIEKLTSDDLRATRLRALFDAITQLEARAEAGTLSREMGSLYVDALAMANRDGEAHAVLDRLAEQHPGSAEAFRIRHAELYDQAGDWQQVYETLRGYRPRDRALSAPFILRCKALFNLRLYLCALADAERAVALFPDSSQAIALLVSVLEGMGETERAAYVLARTRVRKTRDIQRFEVMLLYGTERFREAERRCSEWLIPRLSIPSWKEQALVLPEAERALHWDETLVRTPSELAAGAATVRTNLTVATSPFLKNFNTLWLAAYEAQCRNIPNDLAEWRACGRDPLEKAFALYQLGLLCAGQGKRGVAREVMREAVEQQPGSGLLQRLRIGLSAADRTVLEAARRACPQDPEVWLAWLVANVRARGGGDWLEQELAARTAQPDFPPETMTRAARFLLDRNLPQAAGLAAQYAQEHADGLLPAYVVALRCALTRKDYAAARRAIERAVACALDPPLLLQRYLVMLKGMAGHSDRDLITALRELQTQEPDNLRWRMLLGAARFQRGGAETIDALYELSAAIESGTQDRWVYLLAAESARLVGNVDRAIRILRDARNLFAQDSAVLNNLIYTLAGEPAHLKEAVRLLPVLFELEGDELNVADTAAVVYMRDGQLDRAESMLADMIAWLPEGTHTWFNVRYHLAELAFRRGRHKDAREQLRALVRREDCPAGVELEAGRLMQRLEQGRVGD